MANINLSATLSQTFITPTQKIGKIATPITNNVIKLSKIEYTILFLLTLGKSSLKEIAEIITKLEGKTLSESFVLYIIYDNLHHKFKVTKISELIEKSTIMTHSLNFSSADLSSAYRDSYGEYILDYILDAFKTELNQNPLSVTDVIQLVEKNISSLKQENQLKESSKWEGFLRYLEKLN